MEKPLGGGAATEAEDDDTPLDPAVQRVQDRLKRMLLVSSATLGLGLMAVLLAIFYRINSSERVASAGFDSAIALPAGAALIATALDGPRLALTLDIGGERIIQVHDLATGALIGTVRLVSE